MSLSPTQLGMAALALLSPGCQEAVVGLVSNTSAGIGSCLRISELLPILSANGSVVPAIDSYLTGICNNTACDPAVLNSTTTTLLSGCSTDFAKYGISNGTVEAIVAQYPLAREVACLKTTMPNMSLPLMSPTYNTTNGTFCVSEALTTVESYIGTNLSNSYIDGVALQFVSGNYSALMPFEMIPPTALCSDCIFAAVDLIEEEYPTLGNVVFNKSMNTTVNTYLTGMCNATGLMLTSNGTLPTNISEVAFNSSFAYNVSTVNTTYTPPPYATTVAALNSTLVSVVSSAIATASGVAAMKARWLGN